MGTLYLMRHGETRMNRQRLMQGRIDCPLSEEGREQARAARRAIESAGISFDRVISSPLSRARESAALVSGRSEGEIALDGRIIEFDYGPYEGRDYSALDTVMAGYFHDPASVSPPEGVERMENLLARAGGFFEELAGEMGPKERVLVMTHGIVIRAAFGFFNGVDEREMWQIMSGNCSLYCVDVLDGKAGTLFPVPLEEEAG